MRETLEKTQQVRIITKLLLLYGFKFDKIKKMKISDFDCNKNTLKVTYDSNKTTCYVELELPYSLSNEIKVYTKGISDKNRLLFVTHGNNEIQNGFIKNFLKEAENNYISQCSDDDNEPNRFTPTGLAKYAIIEMILRGVNSSVIRQLTGMDIDIVDNCQDIVNSEIENVPQNRYINYKIRGIKTYDLFNK